MTTSTDTVTLRIVSGPESAVETTDGRDWWHNAYKVELRYQGRRAQFPWKQGEGITTDPTAADVLEAILSDCAGYDNSADFEDWAGQDGYDTDSRTAERVYRAVEKQRAKVARLLGNDYEAAVFPEDSDPEAASKRLAGDA
jgi:hypothetical protein